jgi:hypothetical protein
MDHETKIVATSRDQEWLSADNHKKKAFCKDLNEGENGELSLEIQRNEVFSRVSNQECSPTDSLTLIHWNPIPYCF